MGIKFPPRWCPRVRIDWPARGFNPPCANHHCVCACIRCGRLPSLIFQFCNLLLPLPWCILYKRLSWNPSSQRCRCSFIQITLPCTMSYSEQLLCVCLCEHHKMTWTLLEIMIFWTFSWYRVITSQQSYGLQLDTSCREAFNSFVCY